MTWSDIPKNPTRKTLRQFAAGCLVFFLATGSYQYFGHCRHGLGIALGMTGLVTGILGLAKPEAIRWFFVSWMVLAFPIGWAVSTTMLLLMFYVILTPVALFFRWRGRDLLCRKPAPDRTSFWEPKGPARSARSYYQQY